MTNDHEWTTDVKEYTEKQWEEEMNLNKLCGQHPNWSSSGCSLGCPQCKSIGFYGPKVTKNEAGEITRKYRACKFCGFWQEAWGKNKDERGGEPYRCVIISCDKCQIYDWQAPWAYEPKSCEKCHAEMQVTEWASDNPSHPFHKLKEQILRAHRNGLGGS